MTSASDKVRRAAITVAPEATIAGPCPAHGDADGVVLVLVAAQLLAVARDEQEGVIRSGPEDQDRQNPPLTVRSRSRRPRPGGSPSHAR